MKQESGVTLIELMVTVSIMAILLAVVAPNLRTFLTQSGTSGLSADFMSTLNFARSESVTRGVSIIICRRSSGTSCASGTGSWSNGWVIFADKNANGANDSGETLRVHQELSTGYSAYATDPANSSTPRSTVVYARNGTATETALFAFCFNSDETQAKAVNVTLTRPRAATDSNSDGIPEKDDGTNINTCEAP